ncbi:MAG: aminomethyl-transferring glycine dehydrogenase [Polyangiaceae bacterium]
MSVSLKHPDSFPRRHIGPSAEEREKMCATMNVPNVDALVAETIPANIRMKGSLDLPAAKSEHALLALAAAYGKENRVLRSFIGMGYSDCITPPVILRNVLQNPGWYTQYTPYQAEISQGRLEALLNFQTMVCDLTGLPVANASLLDEGTAAAEAMALAQAFRGTDEKNAFFVSDACHPQTIDVVKTRAEALGWKVVVGDHRALGKSIPWTNLFGVLVQYPDTNGSVEDFRALSTLANDEKALFVVAADILSLTLLTPPGEFGADVALGSSQRFGVPLGYGGPHAAYFATKSDFVRRLPGRIIGLSEDVHGRPAIRMALQTREQHIRREKATSNICTAQALLAVVASMYAVYHGPEGLKAIAERVHGCAATFAEGTKVLGLETTKAFFDTVTVTAKSKSDADTWMKKALDSGMNLRRTSDTQVGIAFDETTSEEEIGKLLACFGDVKKSVADLAKAAENRIPAELHRKSAYLEHPVWHSYRSETEMLRYLRKLEGRDLSLAHSMIPLGSCTMKLNATAEMMPITDAHWNGIHPFVPRDQAQGYAKVFKELEHALSQVTGFAGISLQPNAGSQGEFAGLLVIRRYHEAKGQKQRTVCLIPSSAHGTNPASAVMAGMHVVVVACDESGNVDVADLEAKAKANSDKLGALMITYPSTHGVFEEEVRRVCEIVHAHGGLVYMDGANMNAQVGLTRPADIGADVCHLNLHKTFCIPHGGGGPGMGPIGVTKALQPYLPKLPYFESNTNMEAVGAVSAAPWGSASILLISWAYVHMMGAEGLTEATKMAIANANYIASRLSPHYAVVYRGKQGRCAHECILDMRPFKKTAGVEVDDIAKRLMDYGFHAPTMSFPIPGTLMIEPTESESLAELDRFCDAMIAIREEIRAIEDGRLPKEDNPLKNAPHTLLSVTTAEWAHPYSRELAAFPTAFTKDRKFFPFVGRINNALGDRKLICTCPPIEAYA